MRFSICAEKLSGNYRNLKIKCKNVKVRCLAEVAKIGGWIKAECDDVQSSVKLTKRPFIMKVNLFFVC